MRKRRVAAAKSPHVTKNIRVILWLKPLPGAIYLYAFLPLSQLKLPAPLKRRAITNNFANLIKASPFKERWHSVAVTERFLNPSAKLTH